MAIGYMSLWCTLAFTIGVNVYKFLLFKIPYFKVINYFLGSYVLYFPQNLSDHIIPLLQKFNIQSLKRE